MSRVASELLRFLGVSGNQAEPHARSSSLSAAPQAAKPVPVTASDRQQAADPRQSERQQSKVQIRGWCNYFALGAVP